MAAALPARALLVLTFLVAGTSRAADAADWLEQARAAVVVAGEHSAAVRAAAAVLHDRMATLVDRQAALALERQRILLQSETAERRLTDLAGRVSSGRQVVASRMVMLLARERSRSGDQRSPYPAELIAATMGQRARDEEGELARARAAVSKMHQTLAELKKERETVELGIVRTRGLVAEQADAVRNAGVTASEAGNRLALAEIAHRRMSLLANRTDQARQMALTVLTLPAIIGSTAAGRGMTASIPALTPPERQEVGTGWAVAPIDGEIRAGADALSDHRRRGATLIATHAQPVLAAGSGTVAFAGEFRDFGLVLIIDHGHEYHSLMAGLSELWVSLDDVVGSGEPVGRIVPGADGAALLYYELRRGGEPVDPFPALAGHEDKVRS